MAIDVRLVRCLLTQQFPRWADEPVRAVLPGGSDNGTFRAGTHPACDLVIAWSFLHGESRRAFRAALPSVDAGAWARARGWALWKALLTLAEPAGAAAAHRYGWRIGALEIVHELVGEHRKGA